MSECGNSALSGGEEPVAEETVFALEAEADAPDACLGGCVVCTGCLKCRAGSSEQASTSGRSVQDVVDAVTGATWSTRNRIMEDLFKEDLAAGAEGLPAFSPPGSPVEHKS